MLRGRALSGARGLKHVAFHAANDPPRSRSFGSAWIETIEPYVFNTTRLSRSFGSAWIETQQLSVTSLTL